VTANHVGQNRPEQALFFDFHADETTFAEVFPPIMGRVPAVIFRVSMDAK
jgi:hypothetical protein